MHTKAGRIKKIKAYVERAYGTAAHLKSINVLGKARGEVRGGAVELFLFGKHPQVSLCYAWGFYDCDDKTELVAVLRTPCVGSRRKAVKIFVVHKTKQQKAS